MFEFTNDCLIGHEDLDQDHRKMFELLNRGIYVLQDEFIVDKGCIRYLTNEVDVFLDLFETIARKRNNVKAYLLKDK